jgi:hypothetical protein
MLECVSYCRRENGNAPFMDVQQISQHTLYQDSPFCASLQKRKRMRFSRLCPNDWTGFRFHLLPTIEGSMLAEKIAAKPSTIVDCEAYPLTP